MPSINRAINYLLHNRKQFLDSCIKNLGFVFPDKLYLTLRYRCLMGRWIDWNNPKAFTEKIQWLKLYDYKPEYVEIVDKLRVKDIVKSKIGGKYVIPTLAVWDSVENVNIDTLPSQFVLKTTHGGGGTGVVVCPDKLKFNKSDAFKKLSHSMSSVVGKEFREKPYYNVPRRIIAEQYISTSECDLKDYKFFCFNGKVNFFKVDFGRFVEHHANYYSTCGELLPFGERGLEPDCNHVEIMPSNLDEMIRIAEVLSEGYKYLRVDLYNVDGKIYFGELTLYPGGGMVPYTSTVWDEKIGSYLNLA